MPISYAIDAARQVVRIRLWGEVTREELDANSLRLSSDPQFRPDLPYICDARDLSVPPAIDDVVRAAYRSVFAAGTRRAIVAGSDVIYGLARLFAGRSGSVGDGLQIFRDMDEAERWLGVQ